MTAGKDGLKKHRTTKYLAKLTEETLQHADKHSTVQSERQYN